MFPKNCYTITPQPGTQTPKTNFGKTQGSCPPKQRDLVASIKKNSEVPSYALIFAAFDNFNIATTPKKVRLFCGLL